MDGVSKVLDKISVLEWKVLVLISVVFLVWIILRFLERRAARKAEITVQTRKDERAASYTAALTGLTESFREHDAKEDRNTAALNDTIIRNTEAMRLVEGRLADLSRKTQGIMSPGDSLTIVDAYYSHLLRRCQYVIEQSLRENDYKKRRTHVARKVRTRFADEVYAAREELRRISTLAFNPDKFFETYINSGETGVHAVRGDRFVLCDVLWEAVESCFERRVETAAIPADKERDLKQRIEEAGLLLKNAIHDHFAACRRRLETETSKSLRESTEAGTGRFDRTPRPETGPVPG